MGDSPTVRPGIKHLQLPTVRPATAAQPASEETSRVLVVEDNEELANLTRRVVQKAGFAVDVAGTAAAATSFLTRTVYDAVVSDIALPDGSGVEVLQTVRAYDLDLPVILVTGNPAIESAVEAVRLGAMQYLIKPVPVEDLLATVVRAVRLRRLGRLKREALRLAGLADDDPGDRAGLAAHFDRALDAMWMAFQPIVDLKRNTIFGYEALLRSREPSMTSPLQVIEAAERLDRIFDLGARVRERSAEGFAKVPSGDARLFINLHTSELLDAALYANDSPLAPLANRVVLEVTERSTIDNVTDVRARTSVLRFHGFQLAVDDLGAGYAGLTSFVTLEPEIVKLDMSLVRGIDASPIRQKLVRSVVDLCRELAIRVVAEGIETREELHAVRMLGCDLGQGYLIGKPSAEFQPIDRRAFD